MAHASSAETSAAGRQLSTSPPDLDSVALAALDRFRNQKVTEEAQLIKFAARSSRRPKTQRQPRQKKCKAAPRNLTPEEKAAEDAKAEAALMAEIEAIADLERLNGIAPDSAESMLSDLSGLTSRLTSTQVSDDEDDGDTSDAPQQTDEGYEDQDESITTHLDVDTFRSTFGESWQLSQFWYTSGFASQLSSHVYQLGLSLSSMPDSFASVRVAFLCCPTAWVSFVHQYPGLAKQTYMLEVDRRFQTLAKSSYVYYNLNEPTRLPRELHATFDILVSDPPFLNVDTQSKVAETVRLLARPGAKTLLVTGKSIADEATRMYGSTVLHEVSQLVVEHHGLANEFGVWSN